MLSDASTFSSFSVNDQAAALAFYKDTLGLSAEDTGMGLQLKLNGSSVFIYAKDNHQPATFTVLNFMVDDIDAAVDELVGKGVKMEIYPEMPGEQDERGIMRGKAAGQGPDIAWFTDPAGNVLSVLSS